ncbi:MAG: hypothetical protein ACE5GE_02785 [Phycisphaerae bacterium]
MIGNAVVCMALSALLATAAGCGKRLRPVEDIGQRLIDDDHAILAQTDDLEVVVRPVEVPWATKAGPIGFRVELTNLSEEPFDLTLNRFELEDSLGRLRAPLPPEGLRGAFDAGDRTQTARRSNPPQERRYLLAGYGRSHPYRRYGHRYYRRHYGHYRYPYHYGFYSGYYGYYGPGLSIGWGYGGYPDPYVEARRTAHFLSELLDDQTITPNHVAVGNLVFAHRPERDERLTLLLHLTPESTESGAGTPPADSAASPVSTLMFAFEVH